MSTAAIQAIQDVLRAGRESPAAAVAACQRAAVMAAALAKAPYSATQQYLPGAYLPANRLISVDSIPTLAGGTTGPTVSIEMNEPGVVVGLHATVAGEPAMVGWVDFQMKLEGDKAIVTSVQGLSQAFAPLSMFPSNYAVLPVLIPTRGAGRWSVQFRNRDTATHQPVFALAQLAGEEFLDAYRRASEV